MPAFTELELKSCMRDLYAFMSRKRPPPSVRAQVDLAYRIEGQSVELDEVRPAWDDPETIMRRSFARMTYVRSAREWRLYWKRASGEWQRYEPASASRDLAAVLESVARDEFGCFFG